jgi:uncharacterized protein
MAAGGMAAGVFGSLLGLGGGVLIVPLLTLGFGLPLHQAVGVSLVAVIMTSSAAAGVFLERHVANLRLGMTLELFTSTGAIVGGAIAFLLDEHLLDGLFAALLVYVALSMLRGGRDEGATEGGTDVSGPLPADPAPSQTATYLDRLSGPGYRVRRLRLGLVGSSFAGIASALFGIGGGIIKVPLMHLAMGVPLRVATATSNLMVGITASASAFIYFTKGEIDPYLAGPTAIGVFVGATIGSRVGHRVDLRALRICFVLVLGYTAFEMLMKALS